MVLECYNPKVIPALKLYNSLGFRILPNIDNPYQYMSYIKSNAFIMSKDFYIKTGSITITDNINQLYRLCPYKSVELFQILKSILVEKSIEFKNTDIKLPGDQLVQKHESFQSHLHKIYKIMLDSEFENEKKKEYILKYILEVI